MFDLKVRFFLESFNYAFIVYIVLAFLFCRLILESRTYMSRDQKKMYLYEGISMLVALVILFVMFMIVGFSFGGHTISFFGILNVKMMYYSFVLATLITFEVLYDFVYLKTRLKFQTIYPYLLLYGYIGVLVIFMKYPMTNNMITSSIALILFIGYFVRIVKEKGNIVRM